MGEPGARSTLFDFADPADVARLANETIERFGSVHVVCNNAGVGGGGFIKDLTLEDWRFRAGVWLLLGALALKTWIAQRVPR